MQSHLKYEIIMAPCKKLTTVTWMDTDKFFEVGTGLNFRYSGPNDFLRPNQIFLPLQE